MKKIIIVTALCGLSTAECLKPEVYFRSALNENNLPLLESIATSFLDQLDTILKGAPDVKRKIEDEYYDDLDDFKNKVANRAKAGQGGKGLTEPEVKKMLAEAQVTVPPVKSKADAKTKLSNFFNANEVGGKLLKELGDNNGTQAKAVQNAINAITVQ